jgi:hypothetical protein
MNTINILPYVISYSAPSDSRRKFFRGNFFKEIFLGLFFYAILSIHQFLYQILIRVLHYTFLTVIMIIELEPQSIS